MEEETLERFLLMMRIPVCAEYHNMNENFLKTPTGENQSHAMNFVQTSLPARVSRQETSKTLEGRSATFMVQGFDFLFFFFFQKFFDVFNSYFLIFGHFYFSPFF